MSSVLDSRSWFRVTDPFPHVQAHNVFLPEVYSEIETAFRRCLAQGLQDKPEAGLFSRIFRDYDAYGVTLPLETESALNIFLCRNLHKMLERLFAIETTGDVSCEMHHHLKGSGDGKVHNDLNVGWFVGKPSDGEVNFSDLSRCAYKTGWTASGEEPRKTVRAMAMIFYLSNPPWRSGNGGETALFDAATNDLKRRRVMIPPINNSLVAFECTPRSFHSFCANPFQPRNAIVLWSHRTFEAATNLWGEGRIGTWSKGGKP